MAIETLLPNDNLIYATDEYGHRRRRTQQEVAVMELERDFKNFLDSSSLSTDDIQRLRGLSADYNVICTPLPEDDKDTRRTVLDYLSSDIPEANEIDSMGLRRLSSSLHGVTIVVDGYPMPISELELVYAIIEPSTEVIDRAVEDAAYFPIYSDASAEMPAKNEPVEPNEPQPDENEEWSDYDIFEADPPFEDKHTLRDELRPITGELARLGRKVISIVGVHSSHDHQRAA